MKKQMMKELKKWLCCGLCVAMVLAFAGCGGSSKSAEYDAAEPETSTSYSNGSSADFSYYSYEDGEFEEAVVEEEAIEETAETPQSSEADTVQDMNRKLIKTVDMNVETRDFDGLIPLIEEKVAGLGGYIERSNVYNGSSYSTYRDLRWANMTIRVPQEHLNGFVKDMEGVSNVTNCNQSVEDVTLTYVDLESHKKALHVEQDRLIELLELAENVDDIITIENRLSQVRYEIESMEAQLRSYDNRVNYSTVYMNIEEVEVLTPVAEETTGERIVRGFTESVASVADGIKEFFVGLIICLPYLLVWGIILGGIIFIIVKLARYSIRKAEEKSAQEAMQRRNQMQNQMQMQHQMQNHMQNQMQMQNQAQALQSREKAEQNDNTGV